MAGVCAAAGSAVLPSNKRLKQQKVDILLDGAARDACDDACADLFFACGLPGFRVALKKISPEKHMLARGGDGLPQRRRPLC